MRKNKIKKFLSFIGTATLVASPIIAMGGGLLNNNPIVKNSDKQTAPVEEAAVQTISNTACFDVWNSNVNFLFSFISNDDVAFNESNRKNSIYIPVSYDEATGYTLTRDWQFNLDPEVTDITIDLSKVKINSLSIPSTENFGNLQNVKLILPESISEYNKKNFILEDGSDFYPITEIVYPKGSTIDINQFPGNAFFYIQKYNVPEGVTIIDSNAFKTDTNNPNGLTVTFDGNNKNIIIDDYLDVPDYNINLYFSSQELVDTYQSYIDNDTNGWGQLKSTNYHLYSYSTQENFNLTANGSGRFINECYAIEKNNLTDFAGQSIKFGIDSPDTNFNNSFKWEFVTAQNDFTEVIGSNSSNMTLSTDGLLTFPSTINDTSSKNLKSVIFTLKATNIYNPHISKTFDVRLGTIDNPMPEWAHVAADFYVDNWSLDKTNVSKTDGKVINRLTPASKNFPSGEQVVISIEYTDSLQKECIFADTQNDAFSSGDYCTFSNNYSYAFSFENLPEDLTFSGFTKYDCPFTSDVTNCFSIVEIKMPDEITINTSNTNWTYFSTKWMLSTQNLSYLNIPKVKNKNGEEMTLNFGIDSVLASFPSQGISFAVNANIFHQASRSTTIDFCSSKLDNYGINDSTNTIFSPSWYGDISSKFVNLVLKFPTKNTSEAYKVLSETDGNPWNAALSQQNLINNDEFSFGFDLVIFDYKYNNLDLNIASTINNPNLSVKKGYNETAFDSNPITYSYELADKTRPVDSNVNVDTIVANNLTASLVQENGSSPLDVSQISVEKAAADKTYNIKVAPGLNTGDYKFRVKFDVNNSGVVGTTVSDVITLTVTAPDAQSVQILDLDNTSSVIDSTLALTGTYGQSGQRRLQAKVLPEDAIQTVNWSISGNSSGIELDSQGNNATIRWDGTLDWNNSPFSFQVTATTTSSPQRSKEITVKLTIPQPNPESIVIKDNNETPIETLELNGKYGVSDQYDRLKATVSPSDAVQGVDWSISNWYDSGLDGKVSVSSQGVIDWGANIAINKEGYHFQIKATSTALETVSKTIEVTLKINEPDATEVQILDQNSSVISQTLDLSGQYKQGGSYSISARVLPDNAVQSVTWSIRNNASGISLNPSGNNATINWDNSLNHSNTYTFYITATTTTSPQQSKAITVNLTIPQPEPTGIIVYSGDDQISSYNKSTKINVSGSEQFRAVVGPEGASQEVTWEITGLSIQDNGKISIDRTSGLLQWTDTLDLGTHSFTIEVTATANGGVRKEIKSNITVSNADPTDVSIYDGDTEITSETGLSLTGQEGNAGLKQLTAKITPADAAQVVKWKIVSWSTGGDQTGEIAIDANSGLITWSGNLKARTYEFTIQAYADADNSVTKDIVAKLTITGKPSNGLNIGLIAGIAGGVIGLILLISIIIIVVKKNKGGYNG